MQVHPRVLSIDGMPPRWHRCIDHGADPGRNRYHPDLYRPPLVTYRPPPLPPAVFINTPAVGMNRKRAAGIQEHPLAAGTGHAAALPSASLFMIRVIDPDRVWMCWPWARLEQYRPPPSPMAEFAMTVSLSGTGSVRGQELTLAGDPHPDAATARSLVLPAWLPGSRHWPLAPPAAPVALNQRPPLPPCSSGSPAGQSSCVAEIQISNAPGAARALNTVRPWPNDRSQPVATLDGRGSPWM